MEKCSFAHGEHELVIKDDKSTTGTSTSNVDTTDATTKPLAESSLSEILSNSASKAD